MVIWVVRYHRVLATQALDPQLQVHLDVVGSSIDKVLAPLPVHGVVVVDAGVPERLGAHRPPDPRDVPGEVAAHKLIVPVKLGRCEVAAAPGPRSCRPPHCPHRPPGRPRRRAWAPTARPRPFRHSWWQPGPWRPPAHLPRPLIVHVETKLLAVMEHVPLDLRHK